MDFHPSEEQRALRSAVRRFMNGPASQEILIGLQGAETGYAPELWDQLTRAGWHGLLIPEEYGGAGASEADASVMFEEYGAGPLPQIYLVHAAVSSALVLEAADEDQRLRILPAMAEGSMRVTVAHPERESTWTGDTLSTRLIEDRGGWRLAGEKMYVTDAAGATHALVSSRCATGEVAVVLVDLGSPGVTREALSGVTSWESRVLFEDVEVDESDILGLGRDQSHAILRAMDRAIPALCAYQVGSCQAVFDLSLAHSKNRVQFNQPIGRFQRVQDHVIELTNHLDASRWATYELMWKGETDHPGLKASRHMTKALVAESHWAACNYAHEVHAGLGADMQYGLAKHTYLSRSLFHLLGSPAWHREQLATALGW